MKTLNIPARYYRVYTDPEVPCDEENFHFVNRDLPILIRDATTGVEFHDTVNNLTATEIAIREIETKYAWSTLTNDVVSACENI